MNALRRIVLEEALIAAGFLLFAWHSFYYLAAWGLLDQMREGPLKAYLTGPGPHLEMIISGLCFGIAVAVVNRLTDVPRFPRRSMGGIILIKTSLYLVTLVLVVGAVQVVFLLFLYTPEEMKELFTMGSARLVGSIFVWLAVVIAAANLLLEVRCKIGPGKLWSLLTGRYHRPQDEERVFLFLDLKSSTTLAETLGHSRYSQLLRECFHDLTEFVLSSGAEIYQFVGDEVVLTWPAHRPDAGVISTLA